MPVEEAPECLACAACCRNWRIPVVESDFEQHGTPRDLVKPDPLHPREYLMRMRPGFAIVCAALDVQTNKCTIYANRPTVCRQFERASRSCFDKLKWEGRLGSSEESTT